MTFLDQIRKRAPERLQTWAVWFWGFWLIIGIVVEIGAAFGFGRKHEGDTLSELFWAAIDKIRDGHGPATTRGVIASVVALAAGGFLTWAAVHLATGWV